MPDVNDIQNPCDGFLYDEPIPDKYSPDCSAHLQCSTYSYPYDDGMIEVPQVLSLNCIGGRKFHPLDGCTTDYQCIDYDCTEEGLFENANVNDCSSYIKCKKYTSTRGGTGSFLYSVLKTCPPGTKYNPIMHKCDSFYNCDGIDPHVGIDPCSGYYPGNPFVVNPYDNDCKTYIECQQTSYTPYHVYRMDVIVKRDCPEKTYFSPNIGKCYYNHRCNQPSCSKDPCRNGPGRFVDYKSGYCENFIECRDDSDTPAVYRPTYQKNYCPPGSLFSAIIRDCDPEYTCPRFPIDYCYDTIPTSTTTSTSTVDPD